MAVVASLLFILTTWSLTTTRGHVRVEEERIFSICVVKISLNFLQWSSGSGENFNVVNGFQWTAICKEHVSRWKELLRTQFD